MKKDFPIVFDEDQTGKKYLEHFKSTNFKIFYRDPDSMNNQVRHFAGFFTAGYLFGYSATWIFAYIHDYPRKSDPCTSWEDLHLSIQADAIANEFRRGLISPLLLPTCIDSRICEKQGEDQ